MMKPFVETLREGMVFEDAVARSLILRLFPDHWIESTHSHKTYSYSGPVIENINLGKIVIPDFRLFNPVDRSMVMIEAKYRDKYFHIPGYGVTRFVAIDGKSYENYTKASSLLGAKILYLFGVAGTGNVYLFENYDVRHRIRNTYYQGDIYAFELREGNIVGNL